MNIIKLAWSHKATSSQVMLFKYDDDGILLIKLWFLNVLFTIIKTFGNDNSLCRNVCDITSSQTLKECKQTCWQEDLVKYYTSYNFTVIVYTVEIYVGKY